MSYDHIKTFKGKGPKGYDLVELLDRAVVYWLNQHARRLSPNFDPEKEDTTAPEVGELNSILDVGAAIRHEGRALKFFRVCNKLGIMAGWCGEARFTDEFIKQLLADLPEPEWTLEGMIVVRSHKEIGRVHSSGPSIGHSAQTPDEFSLEQILYFLAHPEYFVGILRNAIALSTTYQRKVEAQRYYLPKKLEKKARYVEYMYLVRRTLASFPTFTLEMLAKDDRKALNKPTLGASYDLADILNGEFSSARIREYCSRWETIAKAMDEYEKHMENKEDEGQALVDLFQAKMLLDAPILVNHEEKVISHLAKMHMLGWDNEANKE